MSELVWRTLLFLLSSPGLFVYAFYVAFAGDVMAGLLTLEEQAAAASARFGLGQLGLMAPSPSECGVFYLTRLLVCCYCLCLIGPLT